MSKFKYKDYKISIRNVVGDNNRYQFEVKDKSKIPRMRGDELFMNMKHAQTHVKGLIDAGI